MGSPDAGIVPGRDDMERIRRDDHAVINGHEMDIPAEKVLDADGNERWLWIIKKPIPSHDGRETHLLGVATDITHRVRAENALKERAEQIKRFQTTLHELALDDHSDVKKVFRAIVGKISATLLCGRVSVWLFNEQKTALICRCLCENGEISTPDLELARESHPLYFQAIEENRALAADDAEADPRTNECAESYLRPLGITSMLDVPIRLNGSLLGVVCSENVGARREWTAEETNFSASIADFIAQAISASSRKQLQDELRQSQKMQAVGHLAGGKSPIPDRLKRIRLLSVTFPRPRKPVLITGPRPHLRRSMRGPEPRSAA